MQLTISGYSTALFSSWYFIEELGILFDAGDGVISQLLQKSRKIKYVFLSHADRDHLTGLLQLNQLNARPGFPIVHYPKDAASIRKLEDFSKEFDLQVQQTRWEPLSNGQEIEIKKDLLVTPVRNGHVVAPKGLIKSVGFLVQQRKYKLKQEYLHLDAREIIALRSARGIDALTEEVRTNLLGYSGDTPVENFGIWSNTETLIHEATFLNRSEMTETDYRYNRHSLLEEVLQAAAGANIKKLILGHFSSRYSKEEIDNCIRVNCIRYGITFPVYRLLPGEYLRNILTSETVNIGAA